MSEVHVPCTFGRTGTPISPTSKVQAVVGKLLNDLAVTPRHVRGAEVLPSYNLLRIKSDLMDS